MVPRAAQRIESSPCCRGVVWIAIKGRLVPQSGQSLDSRRGGWRRRIDVEVSRSTAVVEVGRRRIDVEVSRSAALVKYGCATVVDEKRCCIFDVGIKFDNRRSRYIRSSNQRSYLIVVWD